MSHMRSRAQAMPGGSAGNPDAMHMWDCDAGGSEQWAENTAGRFRSMHNSQHYSLSVQSGGSSDDTRLVMYAHGSTSHPQLSQLQVALDWMQTSF